jgi:hypothetical protein
LLQVKKKKNSKMNEIITTMITPIFGVENGIGTISHSLTLWRNEKTIGIIIFTRNHGLFDLKTRLKTSHFNIWSIWPLSHIRQIDLNMSNLIGGFFY